MIIKSPRHEGLENKERAADEILQNRVLFGGNNYEKIKSVMPWMDPILYYDTSKLYNFGRLTKTELMTNVLR
jgi:hypothetical protein